MNVNWEILVPGPGGVLIPTYGNYGGPGYSDGEVLAYPTQPVDYSSPPVDPLDGLFKRHDMAYDSLDPLDRAIGDLALLEGISRIPNEQLDPEASVYAGLATLLFIQQLTVVNGHPELLSQAAAIRYTRGALDDIERGLAHLDATDRAELREWLEDTVTAAGGPVAEEVIGLLRIIDLHGFQVQIGDIHLARPELAEAVGETLQLVFAAEGHSFDFTGEPHLTLKAPSAGEGSLVDFTRQAVSHAAERLSDPEHAAALANVVADIPVTHQQKHLVWHDFLV